MLAGPGCARYLADFGADVIKVRRPHGGDTSRAMGWLDPRDNVALWWKSLGRNKRTLVLDLKHADDLERMRQLCAGADTDSSAKGLPARSRGGAAAPDKANRCLHRPPEGFLLDSRGDDDWSTG